MKATRGTCLGSPPSTIVAVLAIAAVAACMMAAPAASQDAARSANEVIDVPVDEARILRLNRVPRSVIIGNPLIADAVIEENGIMVLVGKNYGTTNLIALDEAGNELVHVDLAVRTSGANSLSLFRGNARISFNCSPRCEMELDVGDEATHFESLRGEIEGKTTLSQGQVTGLQ